MIQNYTIQKTMTNLVVLGSQLVQAFLNDVATIKILDEHHHVNAQRHDDGMNLCIVTMVSLLFICKFSKGGLQLRKLAC